MSLINDALQRAREVDRERGAVRPPLVPIRPLGHVPQRVHGIRSVGFFLVVTIVLLWHGDPDANRTAPIAAALTNRAVLPPTTSAASVPRQVLEVSASAAKLPPAASRVKVNTNLVIRTNLITEGEVTLRAGSGAEADGGSTSARFPELKLQSMICRVTNPEARINGETVRPGDRLGDVRVVTIEPSGVTVAWHGSNRLLTMPLPGRVRP
jgi:hypothetical protein